MPSRIKEGYFGKHRLKLIRYSSNSKTGDNRAIITDYRTFFSFVEISSNIESTNVIVKLNKDGKNE